jgi:hypothetical protein
LFTAVLTSNPPQVHVLVSYTLLTWGTRFPRTLYKVSVLL